MKPEIKEKWTEALTGGKYHQVCFYLRDVVQSDSSLMESRSMCVMGVLADLALIDSGLKYTENNWKKFADGNEGLTERTLTWAGLTPGDVNHLILQNDGNVLKRTTSKTFRELAEYIKENL